MMKTILETVYALGRENAWIAVLSVTALLVTIVTVCVLGCMVFSQIRGAINYKR